MNPTIKTGAIFYDELTGKIISGDLKIINGKLYLTGVPNSSLNGLDIENRYCDVCGTLSSPEQQCDGYYSLHVDDIFLR